MYWCKDKQQDKPKRDWLTYVKTSHAKSKIRFALKETQVKESLMAKEMMERRMKNKKIEMDEAVMNQLIKKMGFKQTTDFYHQIADGTLDLNLIIEKYNLLKNPELQTQTAMQARSAEEFSYDNPNELSEHVSEVFGFVGVNGGIKIHRTDCPNAPEMRRRFGYRIVRARWSGKGSSQYSTSLRIIGNDDIGIVNNITSIISKEEKIMMRSINIDSNDGLFSGTLSVNVEDTQRLEALIKKLRTVKGVKQVTRV